MELIESFLSEADELLTRINEEVLALEGDPQDQERLNTVYRTAHTLKGSANLYGYSGIALLTHFLESLLDELRDGLQRMDAAFTDLLLESFDQVRFLVRGIESGQDDPQPESDLLHRLREAVRTELVRIETKKPSMSRTLEPELDAAPLELGAWLAEFRAYGKGAPQIDKEKPLYRFLEETAPSPGTVSPGPRWEHELQQLKELGYELKRKRKCGTAKEKLQGMIERLRRLAGSPEHSESGEAALRLLLAVPILLEQFLERIESDAMLPGWWNDVWAEWSKEAEGLTEELSDGPSLDMVLDVWDLYSDHMSSLPAQGELLLPSSMEEADLQSAYAEVAAATSPPAPAPVPVLRQAAVPKASPTDPAIARRLVIEQIRFLAPRGKPIIERWELARRILVRCAALIGDDQLQDLAVKPAPDMAKLMMTVKPYNEYEESLWTENELASPLQAGWADGRDRAMERKETRATGDGHDQDRTIRIEQGKIDSLMELIGELAVAKNAFPYLIAKMKDHELAGAMKEKVAMLDRIAKELQDTILEVRMLPLSSVFYKFTRFVRDMAKQSNKQVKLEISGEETTLDKTLVEELSEPLLHLVRNAIDHGIESAEERKLAGKPLVGELLLRGWREGNKVWVEIRDDGRGIDTDRIRQQLLKQGQLPKEEVNSLSYDDLLSYIFRAGFTTADGLTSTSGRGVGMDAAVSSVRHMQGQLHVVSTPGEGTCIRIELPMTLTMTQVLQVVVDGRLYGIPLDQIDFTVRPRPQDIHQLQGTRVLKLADGIVPLISLRERFNARSEGDGSVTSYTAIMKSGVGLMVDGLRGQQEVVIKPLDPALKKLNYLSGAAILGDGSVLLILKGEGFS